MQPNQLINITPDLLAKIVKSKILIENGANVINKNLPDLDTLIKTAIAALNDSTKKRINFKAIATGGGLLLLMIAGLFFLTKKS